MSRFRRRYGAGPFHLLVLLGCFVLAGYAASLAAGVPFAGRIGIWFIGAAVAHDLVLWPAYAAADRLLSGLGSGGAGSRRQRRSRELPVPWVNHVRVPTVISACLLAVSFPLVFGWSGSTYRNATGLAPSPYTGRYLAITGILFASSAAAYGLRLALWGWAARRR